jgi:hypothetical protein
MGVRYIKPDELGSEIASMIAEYTSDVSEAIDKEVEKTARKVRNEVKASAAWQDRTGKYRKGWATKKANESGKSVRYVYNKSRPWLVHLLEKGHAMPKGKGRVAARPHLGPATEKYLPEMERRIEEILKNGG